MEGLKVLIKLGVHTKVRYSCHDILYYVTGNLMIASSDRSFETYSEPFDDLANGLRLLDPESG
jgi:hypothetical protein